uniref:Uncharacterized protein n=1 Tax=uncultured bacterium DX-8J-22 TaxID=1292055 RepID=M1LGZ9_9BACT|nr:hypothetical protein [uncultured bacterium DX-8J-22]
MSFFEVERQCFPTVEGIADGFSDATLRRHLHLGFREPGMEGFQQGTGTLLPGGDFLIW